MREGVFKAKQLFRYATSVRIKKVTVLGAKGRKRDGEGEEEKMVVVVVVDQPLPGGVEVSVE
jgi:hypothetical protein